MPGYDIAGAIHYAQPSTAYQKGALNAAQQKLAQAQAILTDKEADNYEANLDLKKRQVASQEKATQLDADKLALQYTEFYAKHLGQPGMTEDQKRLFDATEKVNDQALNMYEALQGTGVEPKQAQDAITQMYRRVLPEGVNYQFDPNIAMAARASQKDRVKELGLRSVTRPGQEPTDEQVSMDSLTGHYFIDRPGKPREYLEGSQLSAATTKQRTGPMQQEAVDVRNLATTTRNYIDTAKDAIKLLKANPDINTFMARGAQFIGDMQQEALALGKHLGLKIDPGIADISSYKEDFDALKIQSAQMQSLIVSIAFQKALMAAQRGQNVSDKDVERFIKEIGANNANPKAFITVLQDTIRRADRNFKSTVREHLGEEGQKQYEGDYFKINEDDSVPPITVPPPQGTGSRTGGAPRTITRNGVTVTVVD